MGYWFTRIIAAILFFGGVYQLFKALLDLSMGEELGGGLPPYFSWEWLLFTLIIAVLAYFAWFINFGNGEKHGVFLRAILFGLVILAMLIAVTGATTSVALRVEWGEEAASTGLGWALICALYLYGVIERVARIRADRIIEAGKERDLERVVEGLRDRHSYVRWTAAETLGDLGRAAISAVPALSSAQEDRVRRVRRAATLALQRIIARSSMQENEPAPGLPDNPYSPPS
jgi:hypothetical protein